MFKDYFSRGSEAYARYRPHYPSRLFTFLASLAPNRSVAWDCGTGNGQAAVELGELFDRVIATDASASQIKNAVPGPNVEYRIEPAEQVGIPDHTVSLVTVGQALHWFELDGFYAEVRRVCVGDGILAVWCYSRASCNKAVEQVYTRYHDVLVGEYWPPERQLLEEGYRSLPFPFERLPTPTFEMEAWWTLDELLGYLGTWSATRRYIQARDSDPIETIRGGFARVWGPPETRQPIRWRLNLHVGRIK